MTKRPPAADGPRARLRAALRHPGFTAGSLEVDGCRIHHRVSAETGGAGPTYVLVHGLIVSGRYMMPLATHLAGHGRVLVPDLPGFGGSEKPQSPPEVPELARRLAGYLAAIGAPRVVLVANSFGCQIVAAMAAERPEVFARRDAAGSPSPAGRSPATGADVSAETSPVAAHRVSAETSLVAASHVSAETSPMAGPRVSAETSPGAGSHVSAETSPVPGPYVSAETSPTTASRVSAETSGAGGFVTRVVLVGPTMDPAARTATTQIARLVRSAPREPLEYPVLLALDLLRVGLRRGVAAFRAALADRIEESLPRVAVPTLVVRGSRDPIVPRRWAEQAARLLPRGRLVEIPGGGHALNYGAAGALAEVVRAFAVEPPAPPASG